MTRLEHRRSARRTLRALLLTASALAVANPATAAEVLYASAREQQVRLDERTSQAGGLTQIRLDSGAVLSFVEQADYRINSDGSVDLYAGSVTVAGVEGSIIVIRMPDGLEGRVAGNGSAASFSVTADGTSRGHALTGSVAIVSAGRAREFEAGELWAAHDGRLRQVVSNGSQPIPGDSDEGGGEVQVADMEQGGPLAAAANGFPVALGEALAAAGASGDVIAAARRVEAGVGNPDLASFPTGDLALLVSHAARLQNAYGGQAFPGADADIVRAYLGFLANGGSGADFLTAYSAILANYLDLLRAGAVPSSFDGASMADISAFIGYVGRTSGFGSLSVQNRELVEAYLAFLTTGGNPDLFARSYTDLVTAYLAFVRGGGDPLAFQGATQETLAAYIGFLSRSGLAAHLSGADRALLETYLANGGLAFASQYQAALEAYFAFLAGGNLPSAYAGLDAATLRLYLETLQSAGLFDQVLGAQAQFYAAFLTHLRGGGAPDAFAGLNANVFSGYAAQLAAYHAYLLQGGQPSAYGALTQQQIAAYLAALNGAGVSEAFLAGLADFYSGYFAYLAGGGDPDLYTGLPALNLPGFAEALNAYAAFLAGGGLPSGYSAADLATLAQYLNALANSGQLSALLGANADLLNSYFAFLAGGGAPDGFAGLPVYDGYVAALQAYYAYLGSGGLPAGYTALTQAQINAYLAALAAAGGLGSQLGTLSDFFTAYYAFVSAGGNPSNFAGLPVYAEYLAALDAYYAYLAGGGVPSGYTLLTQAQIRAYIEALDGAGVLVTELTDEQLAFVLDYLAFLQTGADPDDFPDLPVNNQPPTLLAGANVWIFSNEGGRVGVAPTAEVADSGQITRTDYATTPQNAISYDFTEAGNTLREHGRAGDNVAWTRYERGAGVGVTNSNVHLLLGSPATNLPASGTVDYKLIGGTAPTNVFAPAGESGAFTGDLAVAFGATPKVGLNFDVHVGTRGWRAQTPGGAAGAASGGLAVSQAMTFQNQDLARSGIAGNACTGYCNVQVFGGLFGPGAANGGFQYFIDDQSSGGQSYVNGVAVFGATGTELPLIGAMPGSGPADIPAALNGYSGGFDPSTAGIGMTVAGRIGANAGVFGETGFTTSPYALDANGGLTSYTRQPGGSPTRTNGSAAIADVQGNADALIGRWTNGTTTGGNAFILDANQGAHYLLTRPITSAFVMPTAGRIDYYLIGATRPTIGDGSMAPGTFSADMAVLFGPTVRVAMEGQIDMPSLTYTFSTTGGIDSAESSTTALGVSTSTPGFFAFNMPGDDGSGNCGSDACLFQASGRFTGADTDVLGINYTAGRASFATGIGGAAIFAAGPERTGGSGGSGSTPPTQVATGTYNNQHLLNLSYANFDAHYHSNVTYDSSGVITSWTRDNGSLTTVAQHGPAAESGSIDDVVGWSRWLDLNNFASNSPNLPNTGQHLLSGTTATSLPASGTVNYALIGQTRPTDRAGNIAPGTFTGTLAVDFATRKVGFDFDVALGSYGWHMKTAGGSANPANGGYNVTASNSFDGAPTVTGTTAGSCTTTCFGNVQGMLFGPGASHAGAGYMISDTTAGIVASGVATFGRP